MFKQISFDEVHIKDSFWMSHINTNQKVTLNLCLEKCEETGRIENFVSVATGNGDFQGIYYNDSDVYKVLEGVAYSLMVSSDPTLEARADDIINKIAAAQQEDGYLMCYFIMGMEERWTDMERHEMYCAGHLMEAAVAYYQATGKDILLNVAKRFADHMDNIFGPGKRHWVPGHQEIELALVKLYRATGEERYLKLAHFLLEERGHGHGKGRIWGGENYDPYFAERAAYCQDDKPVSKQERVSGHAVRAMYMYTGMADVAAEMGSEDYYDALNKLWNNIVLQNMYITGGVGASKSNEGFTAEDYYLPNETAYCETCASAGIVFWNDRLNKLWGKGVYVDVLERAMYNSALAGVSLAGDKFFYENPLASDGTHNRKEWYDCSCCPTQIARFIPSIGEYIYRLSNDGLVVNLYVESDVVIDYHGESLHASQYSNYPWEGDVKIKLKKVPKALKCIALRVPGWCKSFSCLVNEEPAEFQYEDGYMHITSDWKNGDLINFTMDMPVEKMRADNRVLANEGLVALQRGPLVYCAETIDNSDLSTMSISDAAVISTYFDTDLLGGVVVLNVYNPSGESYKMIPYYTWDNRDAGAMKVWLPERKDMETLYFA